MTKALKIFVGTDGEQAIGLATELAYDFIIDQFHPSLQKHRATYAISVFCISMFAGILTIAFFS